MTLTLTDQRRRTALLVLPVLLVAPFLAQADATIANVATPAIRVGLGASAAAVQLVIGGYLIAFAVLLITGARLGQTHGYKRMFLAGVTLFGISSLVAGLTPNVALLVGMRVLQGAGAALMYPQTLTGIQLNIDERSRARAIGLFTIALATGAVVGQLAGGALILANIAGSTWRPVFLVNVPICAAVIAAGLRLLPTDRRHAAKQLDLGGVAVLSVTVLLLVVPLTVGRDQGWPRWTWTCLVAAPLACWVFVATQRRRAAQGRTPLLDIAAVSRPPILLGLLALLAAIATYYALLFTLAQFFQQGLHRSAFSSGLILVPWVAAFGIAGQITRRLPQRTGPILPTASYALLAAVYLTLAAALLVGQPPDGLLAVLFGLGGLGLGGGFATLIGHLTSAVAPGYAPDLSGVTTTTLQIGGAIGVAGFGSVYLALASPGAASARHAFAVTLLALAAATLAALVTAYLATHVRPGRVAGEAASPPGQPAS
jgi:MFS family permease